MVPTHNLPRYNENFVRSLAVSASVPEIYVLIVSALLLQFTVSIE